MEKLLKQLLGLATDNRQTYDFKPGVRTTNTKNNLTFQQWCKEFRVSMLHGKHVRHFG